MTSEPNIYFAGTPELAAVTLNALIQNGVPISKVLTAPDKARGRGRQASPSPVKALALDHDIPVYQPASLREPGVLEALALPEKPDLIIVVAYGYLIPKAVLELPRRGCINVHLSLLPRWRGASPINQAIIHGDAETGVTIMQMDEGLDTGPSLVQHAVPLQDNETTTELTQSLAELGAATLLKALPDILAGKLAPQEQDNSLATYARKINKTDGLIDWQEPAIDLARKIRGYNPWPVCYSFLDGKRIRIWAAEAETEADDTTVPGTIVSADKHGIEVQTGQGKLKITSAQWDNAKQLPVASLLNASNTPLKTGRCFDHGPEK